MKTVTLCSHFSISILGWCCWSFLFDLLLFLMLAFLCVSINRLLLYVNANVYGKRDFVFKKKKRENKREKKEKKKDAEPEMRHSPCWERTFPTSSWTLLVSEGKAPGGKGRGAGMYSVTAISFCLRMCSGFLWRVTALEPCRMLCVRGSHPERQQRCCSQGHRELGNQVTVSLQIILDCGAKWTEFTHMHCTWREKNHRLLPQIIIKCELKNEKLMLRKHCFQHDKKVSEHTADDVSFNSNPANARCYICSS